MGFPTVLFLVFLVLKLIGQIDWSWWWVTAPIWIEVLLVLIVLTAASISVATPSRKRF